MDFAVAVNLSGFSFANLPDDNHIGASSMA